jgi:hypothetical protein
MYQESNHHLLVNMISNMPEHLAFTYEEFSIDVAKLDSFFALLWFQENKYMDSTETAMKCQQYTTQQISWDFLRCVAELISQEILGPYYTTKQNF